MASKRITVQDIADKLNISRNTVSKALNNKGSLAESTKTKIIENGEITYDYDALKNGTSLKSLKINARSPEEEAAQLEKLMEKGLKTLDSSDISTSGT